MSNPTFVPTKLPELIHRDCLYNYEQHKHENTASSSQVPWTEAGTYKRYSIQLRYFHLFNQPASWAYYRSVAMSGESRSGFKSMQEAIDAAILAINTEDLSNAGSLPMSGEPAFIYDEQKKEVSISYLIKKYGGRKSSFLLGSMKDKYLKEGWRIITHDQL